MPNKSLSIYSEGEFTIEGNFQLTIEIAKNHLACIATKENKKDIAAFELFTFSEDEGEKFDELIASISKQSELLSIEVSSAKIYINNEYCLPVPIFVFNKEIAVEYLRLIFGEAGCSKIQYEHLPVDPGIINVFRIEEDRFHSLTQHFKKFTFHHTYSNIIRRISSITGVASNFIEIQFYDTFMITAVIKNGNLQLIQNFGYEQPEDVLYFLLNIAQQFEMYNKSLTVKISGMIALDFTLYRELITYFKEVIVDNGNELSAKVDVGEHPVHYFTPFFNLAL